MAFRIRSARGFTLWELVLTLAVLAVIVGLSWPAVHRFVGEQALKDDVEAVRSRMAAIRAEAIDQGVTYQFRYEPLGRRYVILPYERPAGGDSGSLSTSVSATTRDPALTVQAFELAEGNRFESFEPTGPLGTSPTIVTETLSREWLELFGGAAALEEVNFSPAIRFAPDGTADDATLFIRDEEGRYQQIHVRGLTAAVSSGPMLREDRR